jgi:hypothetical protein
MNSCSIRKIEHKNRTRELTFSSSTYLVGPEIIRYALAFLFLQRRTGNFIFPTSGPFLRGRLIITPHSVSSHWGESATIRSDFRVDYHS